MVGAAVGLNAWIGIAQARRCWVIVAVASIVLVGCDAARVGGATVEPRVVIDAGSATVGLDAASFEVAGMPTEPVVDEAASSLVVRLGAFGEFVPDPHAERARYSDAYLPEIYEGLMRFGRDGVELGLAAGFTVGEDGTVYEFMLRSDLRFSNGEPVTAGDFKWSWERALSPRYSKGRGRAVLGKIVGAEAVMIGEGDELRGVTIVDDRTLRVELASELPGFPELLAEPAATVLHRPNVEMWGFDWSSWREPEASHIRPWYFDELPVGTGPFALTEFDFWNSTAEVSRNEHYWDALPGVDRIELVSSETLIDSLDPGPLLDERAVDVVFAFGLSGSAADVDGAIGPVPVRFSVPSELGLLVLDPRVEEVSDLDFRRALAASVTRPVSSGVSVWTDLGPFGSVRWHETAVILPLASGRESQEDSRPGDNLETAVAEFALDRVGESRRPEPITLEYFDATRGPEDTLNQRIEGWSRDLGVGLLPVYTLDSHTWFPPAGRKVAVTRVRIAPPSGSVYGYFSEIDLLFGADNDAPEVARFRELLERAVSEADDVERSGLYREVERYLIEATLVIPLYVSEGYARSLAQPWLKGLETATGLGSRFKDVWIDVDHPDYFPLG